MLISLRGVRLVMAMSMGWACAAEALLALLARRRLQRLVERLLKPRWRPAVRVETLEHRR